MSKPYKNRIVNESDGKPRWDLVDRSGNVVAAAVVMELASPVLQEGDRFGAVEMNTFVERSDDGEVLTSRFMMMEEY